ALPPRRRLPSPPHLSSPVLVLRSVEGRSLEGGVHIEHVLTAPARRIGLVLIGTQSPPVSVGHRVYRNSPQELELAARDVVRRRYTIDERLQVGRIAFTAHLDLER